MILAEAAEALLEDETDWLMFILRIPIPKRSMASCCSLLIGAGAGAGAGAGVTVVVALLILLKDWAVEAGGDEWGEEAETFESVLSLNPRRSASSRSTRALASISSKLTNFTTLTAPNLDNFPPAPIGLLFDAVVVLDILLMEKSGIKVLVVTVGLDKETGRVAGLEASLNKSSSIDLFSISRVSGIISTNGSSGFLPIN